MNKMADNTDKVLHVIQWKCHCRNPKHLSRYRPRRE